MDNVELSELPKKLGKLSKSMRFAGILTLTWLAKDGQAAARESLVRNFTLRNSWTKNGIRITPATKQTEESEVYSKDWYIAQHEEGIRRDPPQGDVFQIPSALREVLGLPATKIIPKSKRGKNIVGKKIKGNRPFVARMRNGKTGIFVRTSEDQYPIRLLYTLQRQDVKIDKKPWFFKPIDLAYERNIDKRYDEAVRWALRSAK